MARIGTVYNTTTDYSELLILDYGASKNDAWFYHDSVAAPRGVPPLLICLIPGEEGG